MSGDAPKIASLPQAWQSRLEELPGSAESRALRESAFAAFSAAGFPTRKHEDWKYTDLRPIGAAELDPFPGAPDGMAVARARALLEARARR